MKYDDASYHSGGNYPQNLPLENAATHMGMLMAWAINKGLTNDSYTKDFADELEGVKQRKMTGREFVLSVCDSKITDDDFNEMGNEFLKEYYDNGYMADYFAAVDPDDSAESAYSIDDSWDNYNKVAATVDKKFEEWKQKNT